MAKYLHIVLIIFIFLTYDVKAQFDGCRNYSVDDGLPGSDIYKVIQDSKGYIWTIGDMGVSRFNGYEFKNFTTENGLPENTILNIYEDLKGRIWFSSITGKLSYYENGNIRSLKCNDKLARLLEFTLVSSLYVDRGDTLWIGSDNNFILKISPERKADDIKKITINQSPYIYHVDNKGLLFGGEAKRTCDTIYVYDHKSKKIFSISTGIKNVKRLHLRYCVSYMENGEYLISVDKKLMKVSERKILCSTEMQAVIIKHFEDKEDFLVVTFKGAFIYSKNNLKKSREISHLRDKVVTSVCLDHENGVWLSTEGHGLYYIPYYDFKYYTPESGIPDSKISCFGLSDSAVLLGHQNCNLTVLNNDIIKVTDLSKYSRMRMGSGRVYSIQNVNGITLITTTMEAFSYKNERLKVFSSVSAFMGSKQIVPSKDGNLWSQGHYMVLKHAALPPYPKLKSLSIKTRIDNIFEDHTGQLWISTFDGLYTYYNNALAKAEPKDKLFNIRTVSTSEDRDKNIWIITRGRGVYIKKGNDVVHLDQENGLTGNMCKSIFIDSGCVWIGTNQGLSKIKRDSKGKYFIENYYAKNGLLNNEINGIIKRNGKIWITHNNSISIFDPQLIKNNSIPPKIYITDFKVNDKQVHKSKLANLLFNENNLIINFIGLSYKDKTHPEYKYKLEGVNADWITTKYTSVRYSTIPAGTYSFKVYARNNDGYWSKEPATLTFTVLPAWWKTWWFITGCVLISAVSIVTIFKKRLKSIRKNELEKEMLLHKISTVELQALRSQMNPHFVFNAINSVQYFITSNDPESSQKYLEKFASLIRYVLDNSKLSPIPLKTEINALMLYMELEALRFKFNYSITIKDNEEIDNIYIPSMLIQPYVENAIWHGLMHKKDIGEISIVFEISETSLKCIVEDNGIGRKRAEEIKLQSGKISMHKSIGMSITKDRLDIINKINLSDLTVKITDLQGSNGEGIGTRVEIKIPFN